MDLARSEALVGQLEKSPEQVQLFHGDLEKLISWTMEAIYQLSKRGDDDKRKMKLVALEYRARLVLEWCGVN